MSGVRVRGAGPGPGAETIFTFTSHLHKSQAAMCNVDCDCVYVCTLIGNRRRKHARVQARTWPRHLRLPLPLPPPPLPRHKPVRRHACRGMRDACCSASSAVICYVGAWTRSSGVRVVSRVACLLCPRAKTMTICGFGICVLWILSYPRRSSQPRLHRNTESAASGGGSTRAPVWGSNANKLACAMHPTNYSIHRAGTCVELEPTEEELLKACPSPRPRSTP